MSSEYFCYLLRSAEKPGSRSTYIGFTNNPHHRLRQHNGELTAGARRTLPNRPWVHVAVVGGFPNKIVALQFEWQWQHPHKSRIMGADAAKSIKKHGSGHKKCLVTLALIISQPLWSQLALTVYIVDASCEKSMKMLLEGKNATIKLTTVEQIQTIHKTTAVIAPRSSFGICGVCRQMINANQIGWSCEDCQAVHHIICSAKADMGRTNSIENDWRLPCLIPTQAKCRYCNKIHPWNLVARRKFTAPSGLTQHQSRQQGDEEGDAEDDDDEHDDTEETFDPHSDAENEEEQEMMAVDDFDNDPYANEEDEAEEEDYIEIL